MDNTVGKFCLMQKSRNDHTFASNGKRYAIPLISGRYDLDYGYNLMKTVEAGRNDLLLLI